MSNTTIKPYTAAKRATEALKAVGIDYTVRTQMMYNYTTAKLRAGERTIIKCSEEGIDVEDFERWLHQVYLPGQLKKRGMVVEVNDPDQLEFDLSENN